MNALPAYSDAIRDAIAMGACKVPSGGSLRPWAPLFVVPELSLPTVNTLAKALQAIDEDYLREHPDTPEIYSSPCMYAPEPVGKEQWLSIPWCLIRAQMGEGIDCEDIACWYAAELVVRHGEKAQAFAVKKPAIGPDGEEGDAYHILVRRGILGPDGAPAIADPSRIMRAHPSKRKIFRDPRWRGNPHASGRFFDAFVNVGGPITR